MVSGTIKYIKLTDFMTFKSLKFTPQRNLNFIIGSNGSGKSSLICAIVLGLGGKPKIVKRSERISQYIKYECDLAVIELTLSNNKGRDFEIKRIIRNDNTTRWYLNNTVVDKHEIEQLVKKLNIQLDNLCQILPQDRVVDFAKMRQVELLVNTQKAIGDVDMCDNHNFLKTQSSEIAKLTIGYTNLQVLHDQEIKRNEMYKEKYYLYATKMNMEKKLTNIKIKKDWINFLRLKDNIKASEVAMQDKKKIITELQSAYKPIQKSLDAHTSTIEVENKTFQSCQKNLSELQKKIDQFKETSDYNVIKCIDLNDIYDSSKKNIVRKKQKYKEALKQLNESTRTSKKANARTPSIEAKISENNKKLDQIMAQGNFLKSEKMKIVKSIAVMENNIQTTKNKLNQLKSRGQVKLEFLKGLDNDTYRAVLWLRDNKARFSKIIYEPLILVMEPKEPNFSKYLETTIGSHDFYSFVCEDEKDCFLFMQELRDELKLRINCVMAPTKPLSFYKPRISTAEIKRFYFNYYVSDIFDAPDKVKTYLFHNYLLNNIPIGGSQARPMTNIMFSNGFKKLIIESEIYNLKVSRYGSCEKVISSYRIRDPKFLSKNFWTSPEEIQKLNFQLEELQDQQKTKRGMLTGFEEKLTENKKQSDEMFHLNSASRQEIADTVSLKLLCDQHDHVKENSQKEEKEARMETEGALAKINHLLEAVVQHSSNSKDLLSQYLKLSEEQLKRQFMVASLKLQREKLDKSKKEITSKIEQIHKSMNSYIADIAKDSEKAKEILKTIEHDSGSKIIREHLPKELAQIFSSLPEDYDELDRLYFKEEAMILCLPETDPQDVIDLEENEKRLAELKYDLDTQKKQMDSIKDQITKTKELWLPSVKKLVEKIDKNFNKFMVLLNFAGEITLNEGNNPDDFNNYGICIRVKFRPRDPLMELTSTYQSGGERSVATIIYMMSLQELTQVPFRCLDEINQGMDSTNERRVYELVSQISSSSNCSQYFLITPKLLPGLSLGPSTAITVLNQVACNKLKKTNQRARGRQLE